MKRFDGLKDILTGEDMIPEVKDNILTWGSVKVKINGKTYKNAYLEITTNKFSSLSSYVICFTENKEYQVKVLPMFQVYQFEILEQYKAHDFSASFFA